MADITPQDLGNSLSVLQFLLDYAKANNNTQMKETVERLMSDYANVFNEVDKSDLTMLPYNRKDAYSILEYLKLQAEQLSEGRWTDFSDSDIGTVFLKLMAYLADMNNFQVDKVASELYLDTCTERASALALCALIGYEPRHYKSAYCNLTITNRLNSEITNGTIIPAYSVFTNADNTIKYCNLKEETIYDNFITFRVYQGEPIKAQFQMQDITTLGRIILKDYNVGTNTISLKINGQEYKQVDDVRFVNGDLAFSVHMSEDAYLYIQLPAYWTDIVTQGSKIEVNYLLSNGTEGRIGRNILTQIEQMSSTEQYNMDIFGNTPSEEGYDPETVDEMRISVPRHARTMDTIVTINDFEEVSMNVLGIADVSALDYNDPSSGLIQPDDYYKVYMYVLPEADNYDAADEDTTKYRNTIIKDRNDWVFDDMAQVAEDVDTHSKSSIQGAIIVLENAANTYQAADIVPAIEVTPNTANSYLIWQVDYSEIQSLDDDIYYSIRQSGNDYIINFNPNWRDFVDDTDKISIFFKKGQVLTEKGERLRQYVDHRRLTSLNVTYHDLDIVQPTIVIDVYMDKNDVSFNTMSTQVKDFILDKYSRKYLKIGEPIFASVIGADILTKFSNIRYCEVRNPAEKIEVLPRGFIDVVPAVIENGDVVEKLIVNVYDYQNRVI